MNEERPIRQLLLVAVGAVLLACAGVYVATTRWNSEVSAAGGSGDGGEVETLRVLNQQLVESAESRARTERTLAEARASKLLQEVAETKSVAEKAEAAATRWSAEVPALLTSEAGRRLASDPARVTTFYALMDRPGRPTPESIEGIKGRLVALETELERVKSESSAKLAEESEAALAALVREEKAAADAALSVNERDLDAVEALVRASESDALAPTTLEETLAAMRAELAKKHAEDIAAEVRRVTEEQHEITKKMIAEREAERLIAEREKDDARRKAENARIANETELAKKKAEDALWETRAKSAEVQAKFRAFLADGNAQPQRHRSRQIIWNVARGADPRPGPVSYKAIVDVGGMKDFTSFLQLVVPTTLNEGLRNDRGMWDDPAGNAARLKEYEQRFEDFKRLGPIWVRLGLMKE